MKKSLGPPKEMIELVKRSRPSAAQEIASVRRAVDFYEGVLKQVAATGAEDPVGILARSTHHPAGLERIAQESLLSGADIKEVSDHTFECTIPTDTPLESLLDLVARSGLRPAIAAEVSKYAARIDEGSVILCIRPADFRCDVPDAIVFDRSGRTSLGGEYTIKYKPLPAGSTFLAFSGYKSNVLEDRSNVDRRPLSNTGFYWTKVDDLGLRDVHAIITAQGRRIGTADEFARFVLPKDIGDHAEVTRTPLVVMGSQSYHSVHILPSFYSDPEEEVNFMTEDVKLPKLTWIYTCEAEEAEVAK